MASQPLYLSPSVAIEPLVDHWYAWWYLLAPATAAMFTAKMHIPLLQSFVTSPAAHVAALANPALRGGPFLDCAADQVPAVQRLLDRTLAGAALPIAFARAIEQLYVLLAGVPPGSSLEPLYPRVPAPLRGYVELTYDLQHRPGFRWIEPLLYTSALYRTSAQSVLLRPLTGDARPHVFSTPRLDDGRLAQLPLAFRDPRVDALVRLRDVPLSVEQAEDQLGITPEQRTLFRACLTPEPPRPPAPRYDGPGVRVRYFGHACVLLESREVSVLTDPMISYRIPDGPARFSLEDLPARIDYVLITHGHADHLVLETLLHLRARIGTIVVPRNGGGALADPSLKLLLQAAGFSRVVELAELETLELDGGSVTGLPFLGEHCDLAIHSKLAHLVRLGGASLVMAADSNAIEPMLYERVREAVGPIDALFLGMESEGAPMSWTYGPLLAAPLSRKFDHARRSNGSNFERAREIVDRLAPGRVCVYAMGMEPWMGQIMVMGYTATSPQIVESDRLLAACAARGIVASRPYCQDEFRIG